MAATASIRDLRNAFPRVRRLVEAEGEVVVTEQGIPRFILVRYTEAMRLNPGPKDYLARVRSHQPRPMTSLQARAIDSGNRGER